MFEYRGCTIRLKIEQRRRSDGTPGDWIPGVEITIQDHGSQTVHPVTWDRSFTTDQEAAQYARQAAVRWIDDHFGIPG